MVELINQIRGELTSRERLIRTFKGELIDRIATYDILHNIDLIEYLTDDKVTPKNAEDLICKATSKILDLVRHFSIPKNLEPRIIKDSDGYVYKMEWWTGSIVSRPFTDLAGAKHVMEQDIERIYECIEKKKICRPALFHLSLFDENFEYFDEVIENFNRISDKLGETVMLVPESAGPVIIAETRFDFKWWTYLYHDFPELSLRYLDALNDYEIARVDSFAPKLHTPVSFTSEPAGTNDSLIYSLEFNLNVILPRVRNLVEHWKSYGYYHIYFADGYKWPILDEVISWGLVDAVDPFEPLAHMDVAKFRNKYPDITICQPIDCQNLLYTGTPDEIRKATIKAIEDAGAKRIIIGSTSEIHPNVPVKNALAMYEAARNYIT
jgi:uroporphyrinogen-III decarboxylase